MKAPKFIINYRDLRKSKTQKMQLSDIDVI